MPAVFSSGFYRAGNGFTGRVYAYMKNSVFNPFIGKMPAMR